MVQTGYDEIRTTLKWYMYHNDLSSSSDI